MCNACQSLCHWSSLDHSQLLCVSPKTADWALKAYLHCHAVLWFVYMLIYGVFPQNLSQGVYHLFTEVLASSATFWLLIILAPVACVLPGYLWRQLRT